VALIFPPLFCCAFGSSDDVVSANVVLGAVTDRGPGDRKNVRFVNLATRAAVAVRRG
jgi:hypothetical protein